MPELPADHDRSTPWCDTCKQPAVWLEGQGWLHSTAEHKFGVPEAVDLSGHEVTAREWNRVPFFNRD